MAVLHVLLAIASLLCLTAGYELKENYNASNFFDDSSFLFYDGYDADGLALYVPKTEAISLGLARYQDNRVYLGVENTSILDDSAAGPGNGRKSVRLEGVQNFGNGLLIVDFEHLPGGCGQWPGFWLMHDECGVNAAAFTPLESAVTGVWTFQTEEDGMKAWFFAKGLEPSDMASDNPDPSSWGTPLVDATLSPCDVSRKMKITINLTFCGLPWSGCAASTGVNSCGEYVANTPSAFTDAYFLINSIKVYKQDAPKVLSVDSPASATIGTTLTSIYRDPIPQSTSYVFQYTVITKTVTKTMTMIGGIVRYTSDGAVYYTSDVIFPYTADDDSSTMETSAIATPTTSTTEHVDITPMYRNQIPQSTSVVFQTSIFTKTVTETMTLTGGLTRWTDIESWTTSSTSRSTRTTPLWSFPDWTRTRKTTTSSATASSATTSSTTIGSATASSATASPTTTSFPVWSMPDRPQPQPTSSFRC